MKHGWLEHFIELAKSKALMSKDEDTKVGSVIISEEDMCEVSSGYNDLPRGVKHRPGRNSRPLKYHFTAHSEANSIANAARLGRATKGCTIISTLFPCPACAALIINAGITKVVAPKPELGDRSCDAVDWRLNWQHAIDMFNEAGVTLYLEEFK